MLASALLTVAMVSQVGAVHAFDFEGRQFVFDETQSALPWTSTYVNEDDGFRWLSWTGVQDGWWHGEAGEWLGFDRNFMVLGSSNWLDDQGQPVVFPEPVPEPSAVVLCVLGLAFLAPLVRCLKWSM